MLEEFIADICLELNISIPVISFNTEHFPTDTTLAMCSDDTIFIKKQEQITPDTLFSIAHELRHIWQQSNKPDIFSNYRNSDEITIEEYNLQPAEIDANAYGYIVMVSAFGIKPLFNGMSQKVISKIENRASEISQNF